LTDQRPWFATSHAIVRGEEFDLTESDIVEIVSDERPLSIQPDYHDRNRLRYVYADLVIVVNPRARAIITVMPNTTVRVKGRNYVQKWKHKQ